MRRLLAVAIAACASLVGAVPASPVGVKDNLSLHEKAGIVGPHYSHDAVC